MVADDKGSPKEKKKIPIVPKPNSVDAAIAALGDRFITGLSADKPDLDGKPFFDPLAPKRGYLYEVYFARLNSRFQEMSEVEYSRLLLQAGVLGEFTRCMWRFEKKEGFADHGNPHDDTWPLERRHLEWAREGIGYLTNSALGGVIHRRLCASNNEIVIKQTDQACALC